MKQLLFDVYNKWNLCPVRGAGAYIYDAEGGKYLDFYGGHGVISIGHGHPRWADALKSQIDQLAFYSNAVEIPLQEELASSLAQISGYPDHRLFLCSSGAEANENALKLASFHNGRPRVVAFRRAFHGRTSGAVAITDNQSIVSPFNSKHDVTFLPLEAPDLVRTELAKGDVAAVIIEGIQGVAGVYIPSDLFLQEIRKICSEYGTLLILDEVQSGVGRTGKFFAHQYSGIEADLVTVAKGLGNGFPVGAVLAHPGISAWKGMLGTTFGGNHLACAAALAVVDTIRDARLMANASKCSTALRAKLENIPGCIEVRGRGLMIGIEFEGEAAAVHKKLLEANVITGTAANKHTLRLLPPLNINRSHVRKFRDAVTRVISESHAAFH